jgi:hypothetical protein
VAWAAWAAWTCNERASASYFSRTGFIPAPVAQKAPRKRGFFMAAPIMIAKS